MAETPVPEAGPALSGAEVNDLLIFMAVVEAGSFAGGARAMGLSRSASGKAVARLEARFGARLLNRTTRTIALTEAGRTLLGHGMALRQVLASAGQGLGSGPGKPRGRLRIAAPDAYGRRVILPAVQRFMALWPEVQVELRLSDQVRDLLRDGVDMAIRLGASEPAAGLISRRLSLETLHLVAAPDYLARHEPPQRVEQLSRHDLLFHASADRRLIWRLREVDGSWMRVQGHSRLRIDNGEALREAALAGMGIALLPGFLVEADLEDGRLQAVLPGAAAEDLPVLALYPHKRLLDGNVRHFIDLLAEETRS